MWPGREHGAVESRAGAESGGWLMGPEFGKEVGEYENMQVPLRSKVNRCFQSPLGSGVSKPLLQSGQSRCHGL